MNPGSPDLSLEYHQLRNLIFSGQWEDCVKTIETKELFKDLEPERRCRACFLIWQPCFLEQLASQDTDAIPILRHRIAPLAYGHREVHSLALSIITSNPSHKRELIQRRGELFEDVARNMPAWVRIPQRRLKRLVEMASIQQQVACPYHNMPVFEITLYEDHQCSYKRLPWRRSQWRRSERGSDQSSCLPTESAMPPGSRGKSFSPGDLVLRKASASKPMEQGKAVSELGRPLSSGGSHRARYLQAPGSGWEVHSPDMEFRQPPRVSLVGRSILDERPSLSQAAQASSVAALDSRLTPGTVSASFPATSGARWPGLVYTISSHFPSFCFPLSPSLSLGRILQPHHLFSLSLSLPQGCQRKERSGAMKVT